MNYINTEKYIKNIVIIIILTNIPVILTLPLYYSKAIGWILGSLGSIINFIWLAKNVKANFELQEAKAKLKALKGYYLRFVFLITYSVLVVWLLKPDIIVFGMGLLSYQIAIYIHEIVSRIKSSK
ncbi:MAG: ATP synthase subunit I [Candidatus Cloacimonetes bacterium]|nr:ATP synthase subunit I [Candidatus Cloacimonadota bacterium]